jgi:DnaJ-class molecular chaperone
MKDYYKILNIRKTANTEEIKKAYRQAALFWHPDKNKASDAHAKFIEINEAYNILIDSEKRAVYNMLYEFHFKISTDLIVRQETKFDYKIYQDWVQESRVKAEKLAKVSIDNILTDSFHFIDKYGWVVLLTVFGIFMLIAISLKK